MWHCDFQTRSKHSSSGSGSRDSTRRLHTFDRNPSNVAATFVKAKSESQLEICRYFWHGLSRLTPAALSSVIAYEYARCTIARDDLQQVKQAHVHTAVRWPCGPSAPSVRSGVRIVLRSEFELIFQTYFASSQPLNPFNDDAFSTQTGQ